MHGRENSRVFLFGCLGFDALAIGFALYREWLAAICLGLIAFALLGAYAQALSNHEFEE